MYLVYVLVLMPVAYTSLRYGTQLHSSVQYYFSSTVLLMCLKRPIGQKDRFKRFFESFYTKNIFLTSF